MPAVCYLLSDVCYLLSAVCCLLSTVCCLLSANAVCCLLSAVCYLLSAVCCVLSAAYCLMSALLARLSFVTPLFIGIHILVSVYECFAVPWHSRPLQTSSKKIYI
jgi:hypothetical protein